MTFSQVGREFNFTGSKRAELIFYHRAQFDVGNMPDPPLDVYRTALAYADLFFVVEENK